MTAVYVTVAEEAVPAGALEVGRVNDARATGSSKSATVGVGEEELVPHTAHSQRTNTRPVSQVTRNVNFLHNRNTHMLQVDNPKLALV